MLKQGFSTRYAAKEADISQRTVVRIKNHTGAYS
jgi:hypothetical protein